jgi:hypothetical protein
MTDYGPIRHLNVPESKTLSVLDCRLRAFSLRACARILNL